MRAFKWCPEMAMKMCHGFFQFPHAHICIRDVQEEVKKPPCGSPAIYLAFYDLDDKAPEKYHDGLFTDVQADAIVEFVERTDPSLVIVVNCAAGVSRSPGVVLSLRRHYGGDTEEVFNKACPNIFVTSKLTRALKRIS